MFALVGHLEVVDFPAFAVPPYLDKPPTGELTFDLLPILTMAACLPTLSLFASKRRYLDFALYTAGFLIAVVYHCLHLQAHNGLASIAFMGINGAGWRTIDILSANVLLARTMGHALDVDHPIIALLPNALLPACLVFLLATFPKVGLALAGRFTVVIVGVTLALQALVRGHNMLQNIRQRYSRPQMARALVSMAAGICVFLIPGCIKPESYYLMHSAWHVLMGAGYYELYLGLLADEKHEQRAAAFAASGVSASKPEASAHAPPAGGPAAPAIHTPLEEVGTTQRAGLRPRRAGLGRV